MLFILALFASICTPQGNLRNRLILSPPTSVTHVAASHITLEVRGDGFESVTAFVGGSEYSGIRSFASAQFVNTRLHDRFLIINVALLEEKNTIRVEARTPKGLVQKELLTVLSSGGAQPLSVRPTPQIVDSLPATVDLNVRVGSSIKTQTTYVDWETDGIIDQFSSTGNAIPITLDHFVRVKPTVTVRTTTNLLFSSLAERTPSLTALPSSLPDAALAIRDAGAMITDLEQHLPTGHVFVLGSWAPSVRVFDSLGALVQEIPLPGILNPQGMGIDSDRNLYLADTGNNRVVKLIAAFDYEPDTDISPDGSFGTPGTGPGQFSNPLDVAVGDLFKEPHIFVADSGNGRIQRFSKIGVFEMAFGAEEDSKTNLVTPAALLVPPSGGLLVADQGAHWVAYFSSDGELRQTIGQGALIAPQLLGLDPYTGALLVDDHATSVIKSFRLQGDLTRTYRFLPMPPSGATLLRTDSGPRLVAASSASEELAVIPLVQDPPSLTPSALVGRFLSALAQSDTASARLFLTEELGVRFDEAILDAAALADAVMTAQSVSDINITRYRPYSSVVTATTIDSARTLEFVVSRQEATAEWVISAF